VIDSRRERNRARAKINRCDSKSHQLMPMSALRLARQSTCVDSTERSEVSRSMLQKSTSTHRPLAWAATFYSWTPTAGPERGCGYNQTLSQLSCIPELLDLSLEKRTRKSAEYQPKLQLSEGAHF